MRCYLMRGGRIEGVTFLKSAPDDALIAEAKDIFAQRLGQNFDGFEVWDGTRFVYRSDRSSPATGLGESGGGPRL